MPLPMPKTDTAAMTPGAAVVAASAARPTPCNRNTADASYRAGSSRAVAGEEKAAGHLHQAHQPRREGGKAHAAPAFEQVGDEVDGDGRDGEGAQDEGDGEVPEGARGERRSRCDLALGEARRQIAGHQWRYPLLGARRRRPEEEGV